MRHGLMTVLAARNQIAFQCSVGHLYIFQQFILRILIPVKLMMNMSRLSVFPAYLTELALVSVLSQNGFAQPAPLFAEVKRVSGFLMQFAH